MQNVVGGDEAIDRSRTPDIVADAAVHILSQPSRACTGNTFIDADVLRSTGLEDLSRYGAGGALEYDIFVDHAASDRAEPERRPL